MAQPKCLVDEFGVIMEAHKVLPDDKHRIALVAALAELENNECHTVRDFPVTRLHRVTGIKQAIYRADIQKISGWRLHLQYTNGQLHLKDVVKGGKHDDVVEVIKSKKKRYTDDH